MIKKPKHIEKRRFDKLFTLPQDFPERLYWIDYMKVYSSNDYYWYIPKAMSVKSENIQILKERLKVLHDIALDDKWDYILIDCPPNLGILVINALVAAQEVIVPVLAQILSVVGLSQLLETLEVVKDRINPNIRISGIVTCRYDARTRHSQEVMEILKDRFGDLVCKTVIRENIRIAEAPSFSQPVSVYDPHSRGTEDFRQLAKEIISQTGTLS